MESLVLHFFQHMDLNKDGKPDVDQAKALIEKYSPFVKAALPHVESFLKSGGLAAVVKVLGPHLSPAALEALQKLESIAESGLVA